jgi:hypothetical protein
MYSAIEKEFTMFFFPTLRTSAHRHTNITVEHSVRLSG